MKLYESGKIETFKNDDDRRIYVKAEDMIWTLIDGMSTESRKELIATMFAIEEFNEAAAEMLAGDNSDENSGNGNPGDVLRKALLPHANKSARQLVENVINKNVELSEKLATQKKFVDKLLNEWPDSYKKYIPKQDYVHYQNMYLSDGKYEKLIEYVENNENY